jgi:hypothetical protein
MSTVHDEFLSAFATMCDAIHQAHAGHTHWFCIYMDNLIYRPIFGKSAKQLREMTGLSRKAKLPATLPDEALQEMIRHMTFITEHLHEGLDYPAIKELVLSILPGEPLALTSVPVPEPKAMPGRRKRLHHGPVPMPGQLTLPGMEDERQGQE